TATDAAGNVSAEGTRSVSVDTAADPGAPAAPTIAAVAGDDVVSGTEAQAGVTVSGTAVGAATVNLLWGSTSKPGIPVDADGNWSVTFDAAELPEGANPIGAVAVDASGLESAPATRPVTVDTVSAAPTVTVNPDGSISISGADAN